MKQLLQIFFLIIVNQAVTAQINLELQQFAQGFTRPVDIANAGDERLFIVEQRGFIKIIDGNGQVLPEPFLNISSRVNSGGNERGLLGLVFHPDYANNGWFYVNYTNLQGHTHISKFRVSDSDPNLADPDSEVILLFQNQPFVNHNAGDLNFGPDGYLYFGLGDGGSGGDPRNFAQNTMSLLGKMLRIDVDSDSLYAIPFDNPFIDNTDYLPEIWATGLRNPWRFTFDRFGNMWIADVGQDSWEEIDFQPFGSPGGENYGWRCFEGEAPFNQTGCGPDSIYVNPVFVYQNTAALGCSVTGGLVYRGCEYPGMYDHYLLTDFCSGRFWSVGYCPADTCQQTFTPAVLNNLDDQEYVSFGEDYNGEMYVAALSSGEILRVTDKNERFIAPQIDSTDSGLNVEPVYSGYQWLLNDEPIPGANSPDFVPEESGNYSVEVSSRTGCTKVSEAIFVDIISSAREISGDTNLKITPNPAKELITISLKNSQLGKINAFSIFDLNGKKLRNFSFQELADLKFQINLAGFQPGVYFLKATASEKTFMTKFVKK